MVPVSENLNRANFRISAGMRLSRRISAAADVNFVEEFRATLDTLRGKA
jgi:hypothetical protein